MQILPIPRLTVVNQKSMQSTGVDVCKAQRDFLQGYADNPVGFAYDILKVKYLTVDQIAILESVCDHQETNVQSSHGTGKTWIAAVLVLFWVFCVQGLCVTTAPTRRQVNELLWSEVRKLYGDNAKALGGDSGVTYLRLDESARAYGFTAKSNDSNGFQGVHHEKLLLIEDEACGISPEIDEGAESCLTGEGNRLLRIGNPIADGTPFSKACKLDHIRIPSWNHSNVAWAYRCDEDGVYRIKEELRSHLLNKSGRVRKRTKWGKPAIEAMAGYLQSIGASEIKGAISVEWIEKARKKHGEKSAFWESRVEARFPLDAGQSIIPRRYFLMARVKFDNLTVEEWNKKLINQPSRYGLDVGDGGDPHALSRWQGSVLWSVRSQATLGDELDAGRAAAMVVKDCKSFGKGAIAVDNVGVGAGALDTLKREEYPARGIRWGAGAKDSESYVNLKAEQFWLLREALEKGEVAIAPLGEYEDELMEDWANTYYEELPNGKIKIEDKKKTKERLGRSPDLGDAAVYGYHAKGGSDRKPLASVSPRK